MTYKMYVAFIVSLSLALSVASKETFAESGAADGGWYVSTPSISGDFHHTYTYDVPWDAVHRYPPVVRPYEPAVRAYVPGCPAQSVKIPLDDGKEQTINIVRCY